MVIKKSFQDRQDSLVSLSTALSRIADECRDLGAFTDRFQHILSPALAHLKTDHKCHQEVQGLDNLSQNLSALAAYIAMISILLPQDIKVDLHEALEMIPVSALQMRLKGISDPYDFDHPRGELEIF